MSNGAKNAMAYSIASVAVVIGFIIAGWAIIWTFKAIGNWWDGVTYVSPETKARWAKEDEEWSKDPTNPKVIAQKCLDAGGFPHISAWDGNVTCKGKDGNNKSVNIEVNQ